MAPTAEQLEQYKTSLKEERVRILSNVESLSEDLHVSLSDGTEENGLETHIGDVGTMTFLRERDLSIGEHEESILSDIDAALERMRDGSFGTCIDCGKDISPDRLNALPWASRCIECQERHDS